MPITTDIAAIKSFIANKFSGQDQIVIIRHQIKALELYLERRLIPGMQANVKAVSDGGSFNSSLDTGVKAIRTEIANLYGLLEVESLPPTGLDF